MRFASLGVLALLISTACGGASANPDAKAPVAVTEVSLEVEGSADRETPAVSDPSAENRAMLEEMQTAELLGVLSSDQGDAVAAHFGSSGIADDVAVLQGATVGEAYGMGGIGLRGTCVGGGGSGLGSGVALAPGEEETIL